VSARRCKYSIVPKAVLRIQDVYRIRIFSIPDPRSRIQGQNDSGSRIQIHIKESEKLFLGSRKYDPGCLSRIRIPDPDHNFFPNPDPRSRGQKGTGSRIRIRNTGQKAYFNPTLNTQTWRKVYFNLRHNLRLSLLEAGITVCYSGSDNIGLRAHLWLNKKQI
jgi:hypothetical protein